MAERLTEIGDQLLNRLEATKAARERALGDSRQIIRLCANSIRAGHRGEVAAGMRLAAEARERLGALTATLRDHPDIYWAGYVQDAQKEYTEARLFLAWIGGAALPGPDELDVETAVYLNGIGEAASELRRFALDRLRANDVERAEWALGIMDDVYGLLVTVDFPDAITGGLRRTTDMLRGVLERTRGDVTVTVRQQSLERSLDRALAVMSNE
ncbi:MAG: haloacid dehalogenase [Thermomicrobiales bacterium]